MTTGSVTVEVGGKDVGLASLLTKLEGQMRQTDAVGVKLAQTTGGTMTTGQARAAQAAGRLAVAEAQVGLVSQRTATAMQQTVAATARAEQATLRLAAAQARGASSAGSFAQQLGGAFRSSLLGVVGPMAAVTAAFGALRAGGAALGEGFRFTAELQSSNDAIKGQLAGLRDAGAVYSEAQAFANRYKLTQQELTDTLQTSVSVMRVSNASTTDILNTFARLQTLAPDKTFSDAARAVRELASGDVTSIKELFNVSAQNAHKMKTEIEGGGDAIKVITAFLDNTNVGMQGLEAKTRGAAGALRDLAKAEEERKIAFGELAQQGTGLVRLETDAVHQLANVLRGDLGSAFTSAAGTIQTTYGGALLATAQSLNAVIGTSGGAVAALQVLGAQNLVAGQASRFETAAQLEQASASQQNAAGFASRAQLMQFASSVTDAATAADQANTAALVDQAQKTLDSQIASQQLADMQARLADLGSAVAQGFQTAGDAALALSGQYNIAYGAALNLVNIQAQLAQAKMNAQAFADQRVGERSGGEFSRVNQLTVFSDGQRRLAQLQRAAAKKGGGGGGGGAGAVKLTDQQKLNNTLLADQAKADDRAENLETQHQQKLLDIDREYQKKQLAQQQANELSKRSSEIDFLKALTSSELNTTKAGRAELQRIDAQYYADFDAAQRAAAAGNVAQSEEMVKQAKHRADVELEYAQAIDKAKQDKDGGEVTRLEALREKERQLLAEQSKQIAAGGDPNAVARDEALAAEQRSYEQQQGKIITASDQARERKVDNALLSGKAVTDENTALLDQERILNRIGPRPAGVGGATTPGVPAAGPGVAVVPVPGAGTDLAAVVEALRGAAEQISAVVERVESAVRSDTRETTGAIRSLAGRVMS